MKLTKMITWKKMYKASLFIFFIQLLFVEIAASNPEIDSLQNLLNQHTTKDTIYLNNLIALAQKTRSQDIEKAKQLFEEAIGLSQHLSEAKSEIKSLNGLGICYGMLDQYSEAIPLFNRAAKRAQESHLLVFAGDSYNSLSIVYKRMGDYATSLNYAARSLQVYDSLADVLGVASAYNNMGTLFDLMREPDKALEQYQKALEIAVKNDDHANMAMINSNIALLYLQKASFQQAIDISEKSLDYYEKNGIKTHAARGKANLGFACYKIKAYDRAETYLYSALTDAENLKLDEIRINVLYSLGKLKADIGDFVQSQRYAEAAASLADSLNALSLRSESQELLSYVFQKKGDFQKALEHFKRHKVLEDSLYDESKTRAYKSQQTLMEVNEKNRQLDQQNLQLAFLNKQVALENKWKWTLGILSCLLMLMGVLYYQKFRNKKVLSKELESQNILVKRQKTEIESINQQLQRQVALRQETDDTINYFAASLFGKNQVEEILWDVAKNCISRLGLVDCVIYLLDDTRGVLVQKAAYGNKNSEAFKIQNPIEIPLGSGIVGAVAQSGMAELVNDASKDPRYIIDDQERLSELAVPLVNQNKVIGVIDSEHPEKGFFTQYHLDALKTIASICASKISQALADEEVEKSRQAQLEAEQIKRLDQMKSQFFANISHEFRTPLNLILAPLQQKKYPIPIAEMDMMSRNARRLLRLVNQLLDLAKIEVGMLEPEYRHIDACRFVADIASSFTPMADAKNISYPIEIPERDHIILSDPDKLEKIIYNLLSNAFKFTPKGGEVSIRLAADEKKQLVISVSDTGIGVPDHLKDKIFQRFYQVDASQTRSFEGTGIGLALTKELTDLLGGTISVNSGDGKGCVFTVCLPARATKDNEDIDDMALPNSGGHYQEFLPDIPSNASYNPAIAENLPLVLMVEDNAELRAYVKSQLSDRFAIIEAENGEEGIKLAQEKIPELIITDIMMPVMDGITMTERLRNDDRTSHIPVILLTARDDGETKIRGFETGAEQFLAKPFAIDELIVRIKSLLDQSKRLRAKFSSEITLQPREVTLNNRDAAFLEKLMAIIEEHIKDENFTVERLQKEIGMSRMQLHRKLKALTDQSASDFIRTTRLKRAAQILKQPGVQIAEAAYLSGFNHMSYFSKCFKEQFGVLPSEYAKQPET